MRLPVYPFAKEIYWSDHTALTKSSAPQPSPNGNTGSLEDIIDKIEKGLIDENEGAKILNELVSVN
jgi:hypothetical protein